MNLYLCGMIGCGKTTIGRRLAEDLGLAFLDLDREMDAVLGYSFHRLVAEKGWLAFRELEYSICKGFAARDHCVVGLGGGTVRYAWNIDALRGTGPIVLLEASAETLVERVKRADRPRVNQGTTLEQDISLMWNGEKEKYYRAAQVVYSIEGKTLDTEVADLKRMIAEDQRFAGLVVAARAPA
jgi:shikimate kinase